MPAFYRTPGISLRATGFNKSPSRPQPRFSSATVLRANEQRVLLGFARFARTLLAAIASKGQAAGRDFARLLADGLPLRMTLLVCSQGKSLRDAAAEQERRRWRDGADD